MAERRDADFYPTPPCAVVALREWFTQAFSEAPLQERWLDPAAGAGSLLEWFGVAFERRYALEYRDSEKVRLDLARFVSPARTITGIDSLRVSWGHVKHVIANPPFTLLTEFVERMVDSHDDRAGYTIVMTPTQWWQAQSRRHIRRPDYFLPLCWRPPFMGQGAAAYDVAWCLWVPNSDKVTRTVWLDRPHIPRTGAQRHQVWDTFEALQP